MASAAITALVHLADHLGMAARPRELTDDTKVPTKDTVIFSCDENGRSDDEECDFSSFPSLSLEESPGNYHRGIFTNRGDVESHVESLLSRPILLGKKGEAMEDPEESDSLDEFFVENFQDVSQTMITNFCASFSKLLNSRLRAYASFLARHALTLASEHDDEGVVGIEQKLETMQAIGSHIEVSALSCEYQVLTTNQLRETRNATEDDTQDSQNFQESLPVKMTIAILISIPHARHDDGTESMTASFESSGTICGIFCSKGTPHLRVAELNLNMHQLLTGMAAEAAKTISRIVEMTNTAFTVPLPAAPCVTSPVPASVATRQQMKTSKSPRKRKEVSWKEDSTATDDATDVVSLSPERCANIVDFVIGELTDEMFNPPTNKKAKAF